MNRIPPRRLAQVLRLLFLAVRISPTATPRGTFDPTRVQIIARPKQREA
ncbi:hypothetical protein [Streptacidiphilus rugosus]|nr:hypothetical protein [Streptacidiphilus rugosus]